MNTEIQIIKGANYWVWIFGDFLLKFFKFKNLYWCQEKSKKGKNRNISFLVCSSNVVKTAA